MRTAESKGMSNTFHRDPGKVRKVEFVHQPPGGEYERVTVEYVGGEVRVHVVYKSFLAHLCPFHTPSGNNTFCTGGDVNN